ncbi:hypothetical protein LCGC14_2522790, partial [marine sediment metagenome]
MAKKKDKHVVTKPLIKIHQFTDAKFEALKRSGKKVRKIRGHMK